MGKILVILGADFSANAVENISQYVEAPVVSIDGRAKLLTITSQYDCYYSTSGTPSVTDTKYTGPVDISSWADGTTVYVRAFNAQSMAYSEVVSDTYYTSGEYQENKYFDGNGNLQNGVGWGATTYSRNIQSGMLVTFSWTSLSQIDSTHRIVVFDANNNKLDAWGMTEGGTRSITMPSNAAKIGFSFPLDRNAYIRIGSENVFNYIA